MIKMLASDIDGTILVDGRIRESDVRAIRLARDRNIIICLVSGRMYPELQEIARKLGVNCYFISQNGSFVHTSEGKLLSASSFDLKMGHTLLEFAKKSNIPYTVSCSDNRIYIPKVESTVDFKTRMMMPYIECQDVSSVIGNEILPCKFAFFGDISDELLDLQETLRKTFPQEINTFVADKDCLDVMPNHVSKGEGLKDLLRYLNVSPDEVACVGDSFNDISMFKVIPHSFAMNHSDSEVEKEVSQVVSSVSEVLDWVNRFNHCESK